MKPWNELSELPGVGPGMATVFLAFAGALVTGLVKRGVAVHREGAGPDALRRWRSVWTWSGLFLALVAAVSLGRMAVALSLAAISLLALREGLRLSGSPGPYRIAAPASLALYLWAWLDWTTFFLQAAPLLAAGWLTAELVERRRGETTASSDLLPTGRALLLTVVGPSFVVAAAPLPAAAGPPDTEMGWMVLLVVLTALKRRAGVDDSGRALPGHGGWIDRFDSLAVSASFYFCVTWGLWFAGG